MKIGFDNEKYLKMQSEHIRDRINQFDNKLYLEFGGKLFDDFHASRVLPGFAPDAASMSEALSSPSTPASTAQTRSKRDCRSSASRFTFTTRFRAIRTMCR